MSNKNPSTLQSYMDSASATAQGVLGSITGNSTDKAQADRKQAEANTEHAASHTGGTIGGVSVSSFGVAANNPDRHYGSWNQTVGAAKEAVGGLVGADGLKREGQQQNAEGKAQEAAGQASDLSKGISDRVTGSVGGAIAGLTGNREAQAAYQNQHDTGKTLQRGVESDINKQTY